MPSLSLLSSTIAHFELLRIRRIFGVPLKLVKKRDVCLKKIFVVNLASE